MVLAEVLEALGVHGSLLLVAMAAVGLYHFREALGFAATVSIYAKAVAAVSFLAVLSVAGVIPGVDLTVIPDAFVDGVIDPLVRAIRAVLSAW